MSDRVKGLIVKLSCFLVGHLDFYFMDLIVEEKKYVLLVCIFLLHSGTNAAMFIFLQFDVVPPEVGMPLKATSKKMMPEESARKRSAATVKISPWTLARLDAEEVSKAAEQAKKKSKILQPIVKRETLQGHETDSSFGSGSGRMVPNLDSKRRTSKRGRLMTNLHLEPRAKSSDKMVQPREVSTSLASLQLAARSAFRTSRAMSSTGIAASSPDSSLESPDLHSLRVSSSGAEDERGLVPLPSGVGATGKGIQLLRSTSSDGYEASGGEDSDGVPSRIVHRSFNWANLIFNSGRGDTIDESKASSSTDLQANCNQLL